MTESQKEPTLEQLHQLLQKIFEELKVVILKQSEDDLVYLDNADLKRMFNLSDSTLHRLRKKKQITFFKLGGRILYPKSQIVKAYRI